MSIPGRWHRDMRTVMQNDLRRGRANRLHAEYRRRTRLQRSVRVLGIAVGGSAFPTWFLAEYLRRQFGPDVGVPFVASGFLLLIGGSALIGWSLTIRDEAAQLFRQLERHEDETGEIVLDIELPHTRRGTDSGPQPRSTHRMRPSPTHAASRHDIEFALAILAGTITAWVAWRFGWK